MGFTNKNIMLEGEGCHGKMVKLGKEVASVGWGYRMPCSIVCGHSRHYQEGDI